MSVERAGEDYSDPRVPNLPPFHAWRFPEYWLSSFDGRVKGTAQKIQPPVDENGLIKIDELMDTVLETVFKPGFDWEFNPNDPKTWPRLIKFYNPKEQYSVVNNDGSFAPKVFSELPENMGLMPDQMANALYGILDRSETPTTTAMVDVLDAFADTHEPGVDPIEEHRRFLEAHFPGYASNLGSAAIEFRRPVDESHETIEANVADGGIARKLISITALRDEVAIQRESSHYYEGIAA